MRQRQIDVKRQSTTENEYGENTGDLVDLVSFGGFVRTMTQNELAKLGLEYGINTVVVSTRYSPSISGITTSDIFEISGIQYAIIAVNLIGLSTRRIEYTVRVIS